MTAAPDTRSFSREGETSNPGAVKDCLLTVVDELLSHSGHGQCDVRMRWIGKGLKEICIIAGKEYRFIVRVGAAAPVSDKAPRST